MKKKLALGLTSVGLMASSLVLSGAVLESASAAPSCPNNDWSNITDLRVNNNFRDAGVNIRTGDGTACTSLGHGQPSHDTRIHCYHHNGTHNWTHLRNITTGVSGWVRHRFLWVVSGNPC